MPNIELYGFTAAEVATASSQIREIFADKPYQDEYVITCILSRVTDHHVQRQPFIRLVNTPSEHLGDMIAELQKVGVDIEVMMLDGFYPKK